jgi:hypothetical protein
MALTPMMWDHIQDVFKQMSDRAEDEPVFDSEVNNDAERKVYTGHLTSLFAELQKPAPYYTDIMTALKAMGCVEQLRRGGGSAESKWIICYAPTEEGYLAYLNNRSSGKKPGKVEILEQQIRTLMGRVQSIEEYLEAAGRK